jgi:hypothetical protein
VFPLLVGLGAVAALVATAISRANGPAKKPLADREKLEKLKMKGTPQTGFLTLDEAEDGLVLARRFGDVAAQGKFAAVVARLKPKRMKI